MVLYANYIPIEDISQYFKYNLDYVIRILDEVRIIYKQSKLEDCRDLFIHDFEKDRNYLDIIGTYTKYLLEHPKERFYGNSGYLLSHKFISSLKGNGIKFVDDRKNNNTIWVYYEYHLKESIEFQINFFKFDATFLPNGSKETWFKPAYKVLINKFNNN